VRRDAWDDGLDPILEVEVRRWIKHAWPFARVRWPGREG
jgi:hypothetical protein